eukprot:753915-Hanusia_phi.AAC.25
MLTSHAGENALTSPLSGGIHDLIELKKYFDLLDADKNAMLDQSEVLHHSIRFDLKRLGHGAAAKLEDRTALLNHDLDHDNFVDFSEFWNFFSGRSVDGAMTDDKSEEDSAEAEGARDGAQIPDKERFEKACKMQFGEAAMWDGDESCVCKEGFVATKDG